MAELADARDDVAHIMNYHELRRRMRLWEAGAGIFMRILVDAEGIFLGRKLGWSSDLGRAPLTGQCVYGLGG
jgi:hypothetical protein